MGCAQYSHFKVDQENNESSLIEGGFNYRGASPNGAFCHLINNPRIRAGIDSRTIRVILRIQCCTHSLKANACELRDALSTVHFTNVPCSRRGWPTMTTSSHSHPTMHHSIHVESYSPPDSSSVCSASICLWPRVPSSAERGTSRRRHTRAGLWNESGGLFKAT